MDFFTHLMIGYLLSSWLGGSFQGQYVILGSLMAVLPDFDILLYPLWKRLPITGHHGITHTLIFILLASVFIFAAATVAGGRADLKLLFIMIAAGTFHILGDFITNWGVPPLYPWVKKYFKLDLDMAVNPYAIMFFFAGAILLYSSHLSLIPDLDINSASYVLGAIYLGYFSSRAGLKAYIKSLPENKGFDALPTWKPFQWRLAKRFETKDGIEVILKTKHGLQIYVIPKAVPEVLSRGISKCEDLIYTYWHPKVQEFMRVFRYPYYKIKCVDGNFEIFWHSAEMGDIMSLRVTYEGDQLKVWSRF